MNVNANFTVGFVQCIVSRGDKITYNFVNANKVMYKIVGENLNEQMTFVFNEVISVIKAADFLSKELKLFSTYSNKWYKVKILNLIPDYYYLYFYQISKFNLEDEANQEIIYCDQLNINKFNNIYNEDKPLVLAEYQRYLISNEFNVEYRVINENQIKWFHSKAINYEGKTLVVSEDITSRKTSLYQLIEKERVLSAIVLSTNEILVNPDYLDALNTSFTIIGKSLGLEQIKLFQIEDEILAKQVLIWAHNNEFHQPDNIKIYKPYLELLNQGEIIHEVVKDLPNEAKAYFVNQGVLTILLIPIFVYKRLWGFITFEENKYESLILDDKLMLLKLFTGSIGKAIERKSEENEKEFLSYRDSLTGLYNRRYFDYQFQAIDKPSNLPISLIVADVNGLKLVNDAFGHFMGDKILKAAADVFRIVCGENGVIARWGGDEFLVLLPRTDADSAIKIVKKIQDLCSKRKINSINLSISAAFDTKTNSECDIRKVLKNAEDLMYKQKLVESSSTRSKIVYAIIHALHEKNMREEQHSKRVSELCMKIGMALNTTEMSINKLKAIGLLHDIGKIALSETILNKPEKLTASEWNELKRHSEIGYRILNSSNDLKDIAEYVLHHHEKLDGTGYPKGLSGDEIPLYSKILAVSDAFDAMTSVRPYREPLSVKEAISELIKDSCTHFDINIVRILIEKVLKEKMYKVIKGAKHCFVVNGDKFDPLEGIYLEDETDPQLSLHDLKITGYVNENSNGLYKLLYTISNSHGYLEKLERLVIVGKLSLFPYNNNLLENSDIAISKVQLDSSNFNLINLNNTIFIELYNGGHNIWSSQIIFSSLKLKQGQTYFVTFDASAEVQRKIKFNIGWLEIIPQENGLPIHIWHSFIADDEGVFTISNIKQTFSLEFTMNDMTNFASDFKFEFGAGEANKILFENINITKKTNRK